MVVLSCSTIVSICARYTGFKSFLSSSVCPSMSSWYLQENTAGRRRVSNLSLIDKARYLRRRKGKESEYGAGIGDTDKLRADAFYESRCNLFADGAERCLLLPIKNLISDRMVER
jgi:hypothetical protein